MTTRLTVQLDGTTLAGDELDTVLEVAAEEATEEADAVTIVARAEPGTDGEWHSVLDAAATSPRATVMVEVSVDQTTYRFDGVASEAVWALDAAGDSRVTVKAVDRSLELDAEEKVAAWPGTSDSDIATAILARYGIPAQVEATPTGPDPDVHVVMQRATDWSFLRALGRKWGYSVFLECTGGTVTGHFRPVDPLAPPQGTLSLGFGGDALRVRARARLLAGQRVQATRVPPLSSAPRSADADGTEDPQGTQSLGGQVGVLLAPTDLFGEVEPGQAARSLAQASAYGVELTLDVDTELVGLLLRARRTVLVRGLGTALSGRYLVDRVRHVVTSDAHVQHATLSRNALGAVGSDFSGGGLLGGLI